MILKQKIPNTVLNNIPNSYSDNYNIRVPKLPDYIIANNKEKTLNSCLLLCTNTDNESDLFDWIYWHKNIIGFDKIVIADNKAHIDIKKIADCFENVEYYDATLYKSQCDIYNDYLNYKNTSKWVLCLDDDEILYISEKYNHNINNYLQNIANTDFKIAIPWILFYSKIIQEYRTSTVFDFATYYDPNEYEFENNNNLWPSKLSKTIFNTVNINNIFTDDTKRYYIRNINFLLENKILNNDKNKNIHYNNILSYDKSNKIIYDMVGSVHNPISLKNDKFVLTKEANANNYIFGMARNKNNIDCINSDILIAHYKYKSITDYRNKINKPVFYDTDYIYYQNHNNLNTLHNRYKNRNFKEFNNIKQLFNDNLNEYNYIKSIYHSKKNDKIIYKTINEPYTIITAIFNNYDILREPKIVDPNCNYICITDNPNLKSTTWKIQLEDDVLKQIKDPRLKTYYVRYHLNKYSQDKFLIWCDASLEIEKSLSNIVDILSANNYDCSLLLYEKDYTIDKNLQLWRNNNKDVYYKNLPYIIDFLNMHNVDYNYKGIYLSTIKFMQNNKLMNEINSKVYDIIQKNNLYFDEIIFSVLINKYYYNKLKAFPLANVFIVSDYLMSYFHNTYIRRYINADNPIINYNEYIKTAVHFVFDKPVFVNTI